MSNGDQHEPLWAAAPRSGAGVSRRKLLAAGALAAAGLATRAGAAGAPGILPARTATARNVIFLVADGMSSGALALADHYARTVLGRATAWRTIAAKTGTRIAMQSTHSADSLVTDSSAASSAWSTGTKHANGTVCWSAGGPAPTPLLIRAKSTGRAVGVVTTTTVTHATPGGFYANSPKRDDEAFIGSQLVARPVDIALGGGAEYIPAATGGVNGGLRVVRSRDELLGGTPGGERLVGVFAKSHLPMVLDRAATDPTLPQLAKAALDRLAGSPDGFFLQIEAGRVDHAGHTNDAPSLLREMLEFDVTLAMVEEFCRGRPGTLLVVTTDHATANAGVAFYGREGIDAIKRLDGAKHSFEWIAKKMKAADFPKAPEKAALVIADLLTEATGVPVQAWWFNTLQAHLEHKRVDPFTSRNPLVCVMGSLVANSLGVAFLSPDHTGDHVPVMAVGTGAETLPGFIDNCVLHDWVCGVAEIPRA
ncbi:MAG: alkaline phosphatase [Phycisphaerales bacterium]